MTIEPHEPTATGAIKVFYIGLRKRVGELLRAQIAHTVSDPRDVEEEVRHLIAVLGN